MELTEDQIERLVFNAYLNWRQLIGVQEGEETIRYYTNLGRIGEQTQTLLTLGVSADLAHEISMRGMRKASAEYLETLRERDARNSENCPEKVLTTNGCHGKL